MVGNTAKFKEASKGVGDWEKGKKGGELGREGKGRSFALSSPPPPLFEPARWAKFKIHTDIHG